MYLFDFHYIFQYGLKSGHFYTINMSVLIIWSDLVVKCQVKWIAIDWIAICKAMHQFSLP